MILTTKQSNWYKNIEPEIRNIVYLLRNNGFNTLCSCGHAMYVNIEIQDSSTIEEIGSVLVENGYENFVIDLHLIVKKDCLWTRTATIHFKDIDEI